MTSPSPHTPLRLHPQSGCSLASPRLRLRQLLRSRRILAPPPLAATSAAGGPPRKRAQGSTLPLAGGGSHLRPGLRTSPSPRASAERVGERGEPTSTSTSASLSSP